MGKRKANILDIAFGASRSWQKGKKYARDAHLVEARTQTEYARRLQIEADTRMKDARTAVLLALAKKGITGGGVTLLGCEPCAIYTVRDNATHCEECGEALTHTTINL